MERRFFSIKTTESLLLKYIDILISFYFLIYYLSVSAWLPFYNLYLKDLGFSGTQIGLIAGVFQAASFFVIPVWGIFSDRKGVRAALFLALFMSTLLIFGFRFVHPFYAILGYMLVLAFFHHPIGSLFDSLSIHHTQQGTRLSFGAMRVWGSIGWAVGSTIMGRYLISHKLAAIFPAASIFYLITLLSLLGLGSADTKEHQERNFAVRHVAEVFGKKKIFRLLLLLALYGVGISPLYVFINLYYRDIGASNNLIGVAFAVQAMSEVPFFFFGRRLLARLGTARLLKGVFIVAILRLLAYGIISDPVTAVVVGLAQGATLSLFWVGIVDYMHRLIPVSWRATGQALIWAFHLGAGVTIGNVLIGRLSDLIRMQHVMMLGAGFTLFVFALFIIYFRVYAEDKPERKNLSHNAEKA